ncbi:MAG TPA: hypothetical protein VFE88_03855 [Candidatus Nanoarchaeia archaeon]|nr:hypothetical protein [Candidatus Nanoarchaeia archaeon]
MIKRGNLAEQPSPIVKIYTLENRIAEEISQEETLTILTKKELKLSRKQTSRLIDNFVRDLADLEKQRISTTFDGATQAAQLLLIDLYQFQEWISKFTNYQKSVYSKAFQELEQLLTQLKDLCATFKKFTLEDLQTPQARQQFEAAVATKKAIFSLLKRAKLYEFILALREMCEK